MSLRKDMATAKAAAAAAAAASLTKKKPAIKRKPKVEESSSSSESDISDDEDFDSIEIPGGGKNLEAAKMIGGTSVKPSLLSLDEEIPAAKPALPPASKVITLARPTLQPGYEVIRLQPGVSPFNGIRGPMSSILQQAILQQANTGSAVRLNVPAGVVRSLLANNQQIIRTVPVNSLYPMQVKTPQLGQMDYVPGLGFVRPQMPTPQMEENIEEEENMGVAETYADYMPSKLKLGRKHPDAVVETATMASVSPPDVWYRLSIPEETVRGGTLSALQLESITYASQQHEQLLPDGSRAGFLIGDGPGVGKGRTIAGIIFENYLKGRKRAIWVSVSSDLKYDAERDLRDIGATKIAVHALNKMKYAKISSDVNGGVKKGVVFSTYSSLIGESQSSGGKYKTRLKQLLQWCGEDFDGVIVFDECHRAKNLVPSGSTKPTKTGLTVLELQNKLPKARVIYASATGASEPKNMAYMVRLGLWGAGTPFPSFTEFMNAVEKRGVGSMEIVAMEMKLRGMYIARQLSFKDVSFKIEEVPLTRDIIKMYDDSVRFWVKLLQSFTEAIELMDLETRLRKTVWGQFWSAHQRFFKYLCIAAKVKHAVRVASEAVKCGKCVVIGLQSTGEARTLEQLESEGELTDFVSTAKGVLQTLVEKHFPAPDRSRTARLLDLDGRGGGGLLDQLGIDLDAYRGTKRKAVRDAQEKGTAKKAHVDPESDEESRHDSDSDFEVDNDSESGESSFDPDSDADSDDHNPFGDSDNEDPWCRSRKNGKNKAAKKKPKAKIVKKEEKKDDSDVEIIEPAQSKPAIKERSSHHAAVEMVCKMKEKLLAEIEQLGATLPPNTLDQLIDDLGGPENVAEMTGRKGRVVQNDDGQVLYESRSENDVPLEILNVREKERFMNGEKDVAIISEAASSGISLHADRRVKNQRRRVHITLELPWSADRAIQQFGRTHRSNQVSSPEYIFLISDLAGERRFASIVAKRLESLGALTHGDRRATESRDLSQFNFDTKYGRAALDATTKAIIGYEPNPIVPPPADYKGNFFTDVAGALVGVGLICNSETNPGVLALDKDCNNMSKFLNRILGMPVDLQNRLFKYFTDTLAAIVDQAKKSGRFDLGILDLGAGSESVRRLGLHTFTRKHPTGLAKTELHVIEVERGMNWETAKEKWSDLIGQHEGFYISQHSRNGKYTACLVVASSSGLRRHGGERGDQQFSVYRPNTGLQVRQETLSEIQQKYRKVKPDEAEPVWNDQYHSSKNTCYHAYWNGRCSTAASGLQCQTGLRQRTYNVLSGSVLSVWTKIENVLNSAHVGSRMQVVRLRGADLKLVGTLVPQSSLQTIISLLSEEAENVTHETF